MIHLLIVLPLIRVVTQIQFPVRIVKHISE